MFKFLYDKFTQDKMVQ